MLSKKTMNESMTTNLYSFIEMVSILSKKRYHDKTNIVGVSSISTLYPKKCQGIYVATKSAMNSMVTADIIMFLLSDASRMITGREIYADGGYINFIE